MSTALEHLAARLTSDPLFLASALAEYARSEQLDDEALARALGCTRSDLTRLQLCGVPRADAEQFRADIATIAARFGIECDTLAAMVRRGQSLARLRSKQAEAAEPGFLLAARDDAREPPTRTDEEAPR